MLSLLLLACGSPTPIDFGFALEPLEDCTAPAVPGELSVVSGEDEVEDWFWSHARGTVDASPDAVWAALQNADVIADRREVDVYTLSPATDLGFDPAYRVDNEVNDILTVNYELTWVHEVQAGTPTAPERVVVRWDKTDGTPFIDLLSGSIELVALEEGTTELLLVEHLRAAARDEATIEAYLTDLFADTTAFATGQPLPHVR